MMQLSELDRLSGKTTVQGCVGDRNKFLIFLSPTHQGTDIELRYQYVRDCVRCGHIMLVRISGTQNLTDLLTKPANLGALERSRNLLLGTLLVNSSSDRNSMLMGELS